MLDIWQNWPAIISLKKTICLIKFFLWMIIWINLYLFCVKKEYLEYFRFFGILKFIELAIRHSFTSFKRQLILRPRKDVMPASILYLSYSWLTYLLPPKTLGFLKWFLARLGNARHNYRSTNLCHIKGLAPHSSENLQQHRRNINPKELETIQHYNFTCGSRLRPLKVT